MENQQMPTQQIFDHEKFGRLRVIMTADMPWFVAADVCRALDLENVTKALYSLDDDEKNTFTISKGIPGNPNMNVISEPGLYRLIFQSRKTEAKKFKRWVTHEVLPSLRKYGYYALPAQNKSYLTDEKMVAFSRMIEIYLKYNDLCHELHDTEEKIRESRTKLLSLLDKRKVLREEIKECAAEVDFSLQEFFL